MLTEDYILRMINLAVAALLRAIGMRKDGQYPQAHLVIDQALEQLTGLRADLLTRLDDRSLLDTLMFQGELDRERAMLLADLYEEQGEIFRLQNHLAEACASNLRALYLLLEAALSVPDPQALALQEKVYGFAAAVQTCQAPFETRFALYSYYENIGSYAKAEQILAGLRRESSYPEEMHQEYQDFCRRLLEKPAVELERGGLTREQVQWMLQGVS